MRFWFLALFLFLTPLSFAQGYKVLLTWDAPTCMAQGNCTDPVANYAVYRSVATAGTYTQIASGVTPLTYTDLNVDFGNTYYYYVVSVDSSNNQSPPSNIASVTIPSLFLNPATGVTILISANGGPPRIHFDNQCTEYEYDFSYGLL